jgi:hypothetical protein
MKTIFLAILSLFWVNTAIAETESERMFDAFARSAQAARIERQYEEQRQDYILDTKRAVRDALREDRSNQNADRYIQDKRRWLNGELDEAPDPRDYMGF